MTDFQRYLDLGSANGSFGVTAGRKALSDFGNGKTIGDLRIIQLNRDSRGAAIGMMGEGADNATFAYRLWSYTKAVRDSAETSMVSVFGFGTATLGATLGSDDGEIIKSAERVCDVMTFTLADGTTSPLGVGSLAVEGYGLGTPQLYSPADGSPATLIVPDFGPMAAGWFLEFDLTGATNANAFVAQTP